VSCNPGKPFQQFAIYGIQRGVEKGGDCDLGGVIDGDVVSLAEMGSLAVDLSLGAPYVEAVFGQGSCCESQLPSVVELAVSERVQSLVEEQRGDGYSESPFDE